MSNWGLRTTAIVALACSLTLPSCGGGGGGTGDVGPGVPSEPVDTVLVEAVIGPGGGLLAVTTGPDAGLRLSVPAGAVPVETNFRVLLDVASDQIPSLFPVYRFEPESIDFSATPVTVTVPASDELFGVANPVLSAFARVDASDDWQASLNSVASLADRTVSTTVTRLGEFIVWDGNLHRLFTQDCKIYDPAAPVSVENISGTQVVIKNGTLTRSVGVGSLASFWNSPAEENVLILHGVLGSPLDFLGPSDLVANLSLTKSNVVLMSYPSARGVAFAANELYDEIKNNRQSGFGCSIIGHSIGGLIGRYLIESSATDPERRGFTEGDGSLAGVVDQLIMIGVPNAGAASSTEPFAAIAAKLSESEQALLQVASDLGEDPGSLPFVMNLAYFDNATRYHTIYGDIGMGTDGVITTASALALPLTAPETSMMFMAAHDDLHRQATQLGVAVWIGERLQGL